MSHIFLASISVSSKRYSAPEFISVISGTPPTKLATYGMPSSCASPSELGLFSIAEQQTNMFDLRYLLHEPGNLFFKIFSISIDSPPRSGRRVITGDIYFGIGIMPQNQWQGFKKHVDTFYGIGGL